MCHSLHYPSHGILTEEVIPLLALKERLKKLGVNSKRIDFALKLIRNTHLDPATSIEDLVEFFHQVRTHS